MDGLKVYSQYLENIRESVSNYRLPELKNTNIVSIMGRMRQIEDLSYIDVVLENAGINISFLGDKSFLNKKVIVKSKIKKYFSDSVPSEDIPFFEELFSDCDGNDASLDSSLEEIFGENGLKEFTADVLPTSDEEYCSLEEVKEKNKESLSSLFSALCAFQKIQDEQQERIEAFKKAEEERKEKEKSSLVEEFFDEDETFDDDDDIEDSEGIEESESIEDLESIEDSESTEDSESIENSEDSEGIEEKEDTEDTEGTEDREEPNVIEEVEEVEDTEKLEEVESTEKLEEVESTENTKDIEDKKETKYTENLEEHLDEKGKENSFGLEDDDFIINTDFLNEDEDNSDEEPSFSNMKDNMLDDDLEIDNSESKESEYEDKFASKNFSSFLEDDLDEEKEEEDDDKEDITGKLLSEDLEDNEDLLLEDTDPIDRSAFQEATDYFLNGVSKSSSLKEMYTSKEKIVDSDDVSGLDDALAKMILAVSDNLWNLPKKIIKGKSNVKSSTKGKKFYESMIVEDDDDDG